MNMPLLKINELEDMSAMFRGRCGNALARGLMHMLAVDKVNGLYDRHSMLQGPDFAHAVLQDIGLSPEIFVNGSSCSAPVYSSVDSSDFRARLSGILPEGPFITVSNHPCGHVDGISLVELFGHIRPDYKVMVNKILARVETLESNFISVTPTGSSRTAPTAASVSGIKAALAHLRSGGALGLFPSGAVSDLSLPVALGLRKSSEPAVRDREWQEAVIKLIMKAEVPVIPVRFFDGNSPFYYSLGLIDWRIRLLRLLPEVFNKAGSRFRIGIGPVISVREQKRIISAAPSPSAALDSLRTHLRESVYSM